MILKISPDKERARSMLHMAESGEAFLKSIKNSGMYATIIAKHYYEIIQELCIAIGFANGYKYIGENAHKEAIQFMKNYKTVTDEDLEIMQDLRIRRNKSSYEGKPIESIYLRNKEKDLLKIIEKLKERVKRVIEEKQTRKATWT